MRDPLARGNDGPAGGDGDAGGGHDRPDEPALASRLVVLTAIGGGLFGYPLLAAFNADARIFGIPANYAYLLGAWAGLIALVALAVRKRD